MTAKRFTRDNHTGYLYDNGEIVEDIMELLNDLQQEAKDNEHYHSEVLRLYKAVSEENEQLKERNDRQAKQLDNLYRLIEEKDWRTLSDILDDFKRCEEQLQREWRTYE